MFLGGCVDSSHPSASTRILPLFGIDQLSVRDGVFGIGVQRTNSPSPFIFISVRHASVTPLRHCNRLHCSSLFRLSAHA